MNKDKTIFERFIKDKTIFERFIIVMWSAALLGLAFLLGTSIKLAFLTSQTESQIELTQVNSYNELTQRLLIKSKQLIPATLNTFDQSASSNGRRPTHAQIIYVMEDKTTKTEFIIITCGPYSSIQQIR